MYAAVASTVSVFCAAVDGRRRRTPSKCVAGSSASPFRVIASTDGAMRSTNVAAPGSALVNLNVVSEVVRSRTTS